MCSKGSSGHLAKKKKNNNKITGNIRFVFYLFEGRGGLRWVNW